MIGDRRAPWATLLPVAILVVVGLVQITLTYTAALTPWKGGGFGMFSTIDDVGHRTIRIVVTAPERSEEIAISPSLEEAADRAAALPGPRQLTRLAELVVAREQRRQRPVASVRIECFRSEHDPVTLGASLRKFCDFVHHVDTAVDPAGS